MTGPRVVDLREGVTRRDKSPGEPQTAEISLPVTRGDCHACRTFIPDCLAAAHFPSGREPSMSRLMNRKPGRVLHLGLVLLPFALLLLLYLH